MALSVIVEPAVKVEPLAGAVSVTHGLTVILTADEVPVWLGLFFLVAVALAVRL